MKRDLILQDILRTLSGVMRGAKVSAARTGLAMPQYGILWQLGQSREGMAVGDLAASLHVTSAAITQTLDELVEREFVTRAHDDQDRRIVRVTLTEPGRRELRRAKQASFTYLNEQFAALSEAELRQLAEILAKTGDQS